MSQIEPATDLVSLSRLHTGAEALLKIGAWECDLATDRLSWTPGVYDLFDLPRGSRLDRRRIVDLYEDVSRVGMEALRAEAVRSGTGFSLDAEIVTGARNRRWIRLSTSVELDKGRPIRLFGAKQDVTQEKHLRDSLRLRAERDPLTGLANRDLFEHKLRSALVDDDTVAALMIVDIDHFKSINDRFGHAGGDAVLAEVALRLDRAFADAFVVARIGGDEFAVLLRHPLGRGAISRAGARAAHDLKRPVLWRGLPIAASASIGIAPVQGKATRDDLFTTADGALYRAKAAGRGVCRLSDHRGPVHEMSVPLQVA